MERSGYAEFLVIWKGFGQKLARSGSAGNRVGGRIFRVQDPFAGAVPEGQVTGQGVAPTRRCRDALTGTTAGDQYVQYTVVPNFKRLGPKVGKQVPAVKKALVAADGSRLLRELRADGKIVLSLDGETVELDDEDIEIRIKAKEGWTAAEGKRCVVVLSTELTPELIAEGLARDLVRLIQDHRKTIDCEFTDRIAVGIETVSAELRQAIEANLEYVMSETLTVEVTFAALPVAEGTQLVIGEAALTLYVNVVPKNN